jgi:glycosyltransferase involved in cell wall biosynthesis
MPLVSVVIPTFNRREQLKAALNSVWNQTFRDFELICVDDGSVDGTQDDVLIRSPRRGYSFIREAVNAGVSHARNRGVADAAGTWIAFLDSDDEWHPDKLAIQVAWIEQNPGWRIVQTREIWVRHSVRVNPPHTHEKQAGEIFRASLERCMITPSSVMMQSSLLTEVGGFNESLPACEDYDLWLRITSRWPVGLVDEYLLTRYSNHGDQLSATTPVLDRFRIRAMIDLLADGYLTPEQTVWTRQMIVKKATIVANGYSKRGKEQEHERFKAIADQYQ